MKSDSVESKAFSTNGIFSRDSAQSGLDVSSSDDGQLSEENKRRLPRRSLQVTADVYDRISQRFLGRLVNLHTEGLMIFGNQALAADHIYQLDLHLTTPINNRNMLPLGVECLWTRDEAEDRVHWAGCRIIDISDDALADLEELIREYGV